MTSPTIAKPMWLSGTECRVGILYLVAIAYPAGLVYDAMYRAYDRQSGQARCWNGFDSPAADVLGYMPVKDALQYLTGAYYIEEDYQADAAILPWRDGEPDAKAPQIAAAPGSYDILTWDEEFGWSTPIAYCRGHIQLDAFLNTVARHIPLTRKTCCRP
ncbi:hypothetical protein [Hahella sp. HN01]|uniref:hypothetical protein n=1 Tax=Hahella sp. HN01 TaxID=2847262 RepID=UPI001C1EFD24|nr:hypothetical protein [Hahella sp. HN01]MBU6954630.1 hypothetical protein [Hahella sp. HN01]